MRRMKLMIVLFLLSPAFASPAHVSAKWKGSLEFKAADGDNVVLPVSADLKQRGPAITGTMGKEAEQQYVIEKGKIENDKITFQFSAPDDSGTRLYLVKLTVLSETQLEGEVEFQDEGRQITGKINLARAQ